MVRVRFKRLESFGNYCNAEAEVILECQTSAANSTARQIVAAGLFAAATAAVDEQITAAKDRRDAALRLDRETQAAYWEDQELRRARAGDKADAYRIHCHAPDGDIVRDLADFDIYIPAGKGAYDASCALTDACAWLDELGITPELTVEVRSVIQSTIRESYLSSQGYVCLKDEGGAICWMRRALVTEYAITERAAAFGVKADSEEPF